ncbi:NAD(P)-binding protein [Xylariomycetidae sp. FL0641]|nr:NAD(P)-binding protein [Xylariomycetidae sp. FL0641]
MASPSKKTIAVVGATGRQGSSVAKTFASLPHWHVRCLARDPNSPKAQSLAALGCEIVRADLDDPASLDAAFAGAHAIFLNTDFWGPYVSLTTAGTGLKESSTRAFEVEITHGKNAALAAANTPTLERLVYSALGPMKAASRGNYPDSYHWDSKAAIVEFIEKDMPDLAKKMSVLYLGAYITNSLLLPKNSKEGQWVNTIPCSKAMRLPIVDADRSTGLYVRALIEDEAPGVKLLAYDDFLSIKECLEAWARVTGKTADVREMTIGEMSSTFHLPVEILEAPGFIEEFGYTAGISGVIEPKQLKNKVSAPTFEDWLKTRPMEELLAVQAGTT